jgi:hypothetical protein
VNEDPISFDFIYVDSCGSIGMADSDYNPIVTKSRYLKPEISHTRLVSQISHEQNVL